VVHVGLFAFLGLLFPDGRLPMPRWRPFAWLVVAAVVVGSIATALSPGPIGGLGALSNPLGIEGAPNLSDSVEVVVFAITLAAAASLLVRLRRSRGVERQQIKWFAYAAAVLAGVFEVSVVTLQHVLLVLTHVEDSDIAYFATAMVMAALFEPFKRRIDAFVERRSETDRRPATFGEYLLSVLLRNPERRSRIDACLVRFGLVAGHALG
jgi:hypothetical protein